MKKLILTCSLIAAVSMVSFGQSVQNPNASAAKMSTATRATPTVEASAERRAKVYQHQLNLTPEQYKGVYEAELSYEQQDRTARMNGSKPGEGQSMQMQMGKDQRFKSVLTADQYAKYESTKPKSAANATK